VLAETGVRAAATGFGGTPRDLEFLEDLPIPAVRVARSLVARQASRAGSGSLVDRALTELVALTHQAGAKVLVDGLGSEDQAAWWRAAGADAASGTFFRLRSVN
jgi:EAL domain-containing protein (putative c-di-GMP-specific phosphodiesterase class I)